MIPIIKPLNDRTPQETKEAQRNERATHATLRTLARTQQYCADCTETITGWVALPHGIFLCVHCAQVHRALGRHVSQVKTYSMDLWYPDELDAVVQMGNKRAQTLYRAQKGAPPRLDAKASQTSKFHQAKAIYEEKRWFLPLPRRQETDTEDQLTDFFEQYGL